MEYEVACVDITPQAEGRDRADLCAVGLWSEISVRLLQLPSLSTMHTQPLGGGKRLSGDANVKPYVSYVHTSYNYEHFNHY